MASADVPAAYTTCMSCIAPSEVPHSSIIRVHSLHAAPHRTKVLSPIRFDAGPAMR